MVNRRLLIVVGKGAQAKLLVCDHSDESSVRFLASQVCEIFVDDDAVFDYYDMEESSENTAKVASVFVRQGARSNVLVNGIVLHNGVTAATTTRPSTASTPNCRSAAWASSTRSSRSTLILISTTPFRIATATSCSNMCLNDSARGSFCGRILVAPRSPEDRGLSG